MNGEGKNPHGEKAEDTAFGSHRAAREPEEQRAPFAQALHRVPHERALDDDRSRADAGEQQSHGARVPVEPVRGVEDERALHRLVREDLERVHADEADEAAAPPEERQRADRVGALPVERTADVTSVSVDEGVTT